MTISSSPSVSQIAVTIRLADVPFCRYASAPAAVARSAIRSESKADSTTTRVSGDVTTDVA